ncbi:MAG: DEAD/DEAH box helicase family protein [Thermoplasmatales archaeon]|nr:DEAD/DEAH box helicase family protein [Thermoplasmatales archaeon]
METLNEYRTRKEKIDVILLQAGWDVKNQTKVRIEVDTKSSDFSKGIYYTVKDTLNDPDIDEKAYADYLLLDKNGSAVAVIEAKRTAKDPISGQKQAEDYADDIKRQTGKDVFIFLTNGYEIWFWNKPYESPRMVKGFHNLAALDRLIYQRDFNKDLSDVPIKKEIVDRPYQIEAVKRVIEGIEKGKRKFLIVQSTGTGKTRVAMAIIDVLLNSNRAQKILFLADRKALRDQAYSDGYKVFFPNELKSRVFSSTLNKDSRLYASTIQTFMDCYKQFSIGDFDIIISDESHRSIYNKWKDVFTYFDAIEIGLTATPSDIIEKDTFRFFGCENGIPTALYTYDDAIQDGWLAPFKVYSTQTHFQITGVRPEDVPNDVMKELLEKGLDYEDVNFEGTDIEKKVVVVGTNEAIVKEFMENCIMDSTGTLPAKSIFFAMTKQHAKRLWEAFEKLYPEYKGKLARVIVSDDQRAQEVLKDFKTEKWPRVAISVDMLDTGVDIPEVCNLVFAKPVFSKIKFWQMLGRGTRSNQACKHKEWLPNGKKEEFLVFDSWNIFEWFDMHPEGKEEKPTESIPAKIYLLRLQQLSYFQRQNDQKYVEEVKTKLLADANDLPEESIAVREHLREVELAKSPKLWDKVGLDHIDFLKKEIAPLMRYKKDVDPNVVSFTQKCEQLSLATLTNNKPEVERLKESIGEALSLLPLSISEIKNKEKLLDKVTSSSFWTNVSYNDAQMLLSEFASLMKYKRLEPRPKIVLDIDDIVQKREIIEYGPVDSAHSDYVSEYKTKVERWIKKLAESHPTIQKIMRDQAVNEEDLKRLENTLNRPELFVTEENLQKIFKQSEGSLVEFIKKVLGLYEFPEPEQKVKEAFKTFMIEKNYLSGDQVNFLRTIESVFIKKHHIEYSDLYEPPFTNFGPKSPTPLMKDDDINEILNMCKTLEESVYSNAEP